MSVHFNNIPGLSEEKLSLLRKECEKLKKVDKNLPDEVLRYLLEGEGREVLQKLENTAGCARALKLPTFAINYTEKEGKSAFEEDSLRERLVRGDICKDGSFYLRLAEVYDRALIKDRYNPSVQAYIPKKLEWLDNFLMYAGHETDLPIEAVEEMLELSGENPDEIVRANFFNSEYYMIRNLGSMLKGFKESILRHKHVVFEAFKEKELYHKLEALRLLNRWNISSEPFLSGITELAVSSSKELRNEAQKFLRPDPSKSLPFIKEKILKGKSSERYNAIKLLSEISSEEIDEFLIKVQKKEKSKKVIQLISEILASSSLPASTDKPSLILPPLPKIDSYAPLKEPVLKALENLFKKYNKINTTIQRSLKEKPVLIKENKVKEIFSLLQNLKIREDFYSSPVKINAYSGIPITDIFEEFLETPGLDLIHVIRFSPPFRRLYSISL